MDLLLQRNQHDREAIEVFMFNDGKYILISIWDEAVLSDEDYEVLNKEGELHMKLERSEG